MSKYTYKDSDGYDKEYIERYYIYDAVKNEPMQNLRYGGIETCMFREADYFDSEEIANQNIIDNVYEGSYYVRKVVVIRYKEKSE